MIKITLKLFPFVLLLALASCGQQKAVNGQSKVPAKAQKLFNQGYDAFQYGEYAQAEELFLQAIKKHPSFVDAWDALARTYQVQGLKQQAISAYRRVLVHDARHVFALYELGSLYFDMEGLDSSEYFYQFFLREAGNTDKYTATAERRLSNIAFTRRVIANPSNIQAVNLGSGVNSRLEEYSPALTIDGQTIFFTSRDGSMPYQRQNEDIYWAEKIQGEWQQSKPIGPPINTVENEGAFSVSADGRYIFYTACNRSGGLGQCDIWLTMQEGSSWSEPLNLGRPINSKAWESQPSISSDGRFLYFTSNRKGGYGGTDLYVSVFTDSGWSEPRNLGAEINTAKDEQFPFIHPDGSTLYFSSMGHPGMGGSDLYVSQLRPDGSWTKPNNLGYPINSMENDWNLVVARDGVTSYYSTDRYESGYGGMDVYSFDLPVEYRAKKVNYLRGIVIDAETKKRIGAAVELIPLNGQERTMSYAAEKNGEFLVALRGNVRYALNVSRKDYLFYSDYFDMPENSGNEPYELTIELQKIKAGTGIVLKNIFFDTDEAILKDESKPELEKLLKFLQSNTSLSIEIGGHTDNTGSQARNEVLSRERAEAVLQYLLSKGIESDRLMAEGYGSSKPIDSNETEEGRAANRRTEIQILD